MTAYSKTVLCIATLIAAAAARAADTPIEYPILNDDRLQITLYASDPDIVTPIGAAVDRDGRLYVIESHTHNPPSDYTGPKRDVALLNASAALVAAGSAGTLEEGIELAAGAVDSGAASVVLERAVALSRRLAPD